MIPYGRQHLDDDDINAVLDTLKSDWLTQGPAIPRFEEALAQYCGASFGIAVNSATSALHIACLSLGVGEGDIVWTSPNSFVASSNCALYCGASIDFVDIDLETGNMSVSALKVKLKQAKIDGAVPKVLIPVHFAGQPCDMEQIHALSESYGFHIIEDASHAVGAKYKDDYVGCGKYADICVFSFHPVKIITTMEGGMAMTNNAELAEKMRMLRSHGVTNDPTMMTEESHGPWYYQQVDLGFNYRMTDVEAALGLSQLKKLPSFLEKRNTLAQQYDELFSAHDNIVPLSQRSDVYSSYHLYVVQVLGIDNNKHAQLVSQLRAKGVFAHVHYIPIHLQPYYKTLGFSAGDFPNAERYYEQAITLPLFPDLTFQQIDYIVTTLHLCINNLQQ
ncbi:UDP-4-amino-4,6-dideoxy-N-acetyl-beta-L-altrosamine transaminase [Alteromonas sp. 1_MG-2023]|uniref:UDP-4-amino-4, 6-dideoxy-N-acetyl-beta-L-altrosamine transaminase n=1 Tax=Alteromonas sp. 1_MG-2023 TaxID=3062669 RepID=UPI0026E2A527|nr:UDP-4-amino-4,6-dideoxy-N-acetyl-beta-L-altrosamine transaminase [Alteromonas sp. 1_MG-2023]MDO6568448.1 UDP-4-amino-4,6-dideoxy-N-acetyl-beta-L-altrosamine transaminase [Alteromonas sp. 1_MG-2023]